ncbi:hypothetical protein KC19_1G098300 [Ceratodon purpureus]|uniref:XS domain-containing protein n=1 Tax=Ceratodon purpureus TaxID=3225 RepID=A0A8T0J5C0_CERPU|nr:hypothetical protein KC19_1G098300 [Ceratodon purpureus]
MDTNKCTGREDDTYRSSGGEGSIKVCEPEVVQSIVLHPTSYLEQAVPKREANLPRLLCDWMGILVNINLNGTNNLETKLADWTADIKEKFKEYNPEKVFMFDDCYGQRGAAILVFKDGWQGLEDGQAFQQSFAECGRGRKEWFNADRPANLDLYGWQVNEEDVTADLGKLTEHLTTISYEITWHNEFSILHNSLKRIEAFLDAVEESIKEMKQQHRRDLQEMRLQAQAKEISLTIKLRMLERCYPVRR